MLIFGNAERIFTVFGGCVMNDIDKLWDNFAVSGSVADYLKYKQNGDQSTDETLLCKPVKTKEVRIL